MQWERMDNDTERLKVPGGWLVRWRGGRGVSLTYVPDPGHTWRLGAEVEEEEVPSGLRDYCTRLLEEDGDAKTP